MVNEASTVLIIEDEPVVCEAAVRSLSEEGWTVEAVHNAADAIARLDSSSFGVVLCDLMLPGNSGLEILTRCRVALLETPFIMITGYATLDMTLRAFRSGVFDLVPKPFDTQELAGVVDRARRYSFRSAPESRETFPRTQRNDRPAEAFLLGDHTWATIDGEGSVTVGLGATFLGTVTGAARIDLPNEGQNLLQARRLARITSNDGLIHRAWAPLSGRVIAVNEDTRDILDRCTGGGHPPPWLVRMASTRADAETAGLTKSKRHVHGGSGMGKEADESWSSRSSS